MRRGISLIEVLISMFILAVGLLGIAALLPAGSSQINLGMRIENANMLGRAWYRDAQIRGYLNPDEWLNVNGDKIYQPGQNLKSPYTPDNGANFQPQLTFVIDPLGIAAGYGADFPATATNPLTRIMTTQTTNKAAVDTIFRSSVDLLTEKSANKDLPPQQLYFKDGAGAAVRRASNGDYSWIATITDGTVSPNQTIIGANRNEDAAFSVVVLHKRFLANDGDGEHRFPATFASLGQFDITLPAAHKGLKPGQWILMSGQKTISWQIDPPPMPPTPFTITDRRWYRIASASNPVAGVQSVTVSGADWDQLATTGLEAFTWDGIVTVLQKNLPLEID